MPGHPSPFMPQTPPVGGKRYGCYIGYVTGIVLGAISVRVPGAFGDTTLAKPAEMLEFPGTIGITTDVQLGSPNTHSHAVRPSADQLATGQKVLVMFLEGDPNRPVIVGRFAGY